MKKASYETYAALTRIVETGNLEIFAGKIKPTPLEKFLREQFCGRQDSFIMEDEVLSRLNPRKINFRGLAKCLYLHGLELDQCCAM